MAGRLRRVVAVSCAHAGAAARARRAAAPALLERRERLEAAFKGNAPIEGRKAELRKKADAFLENRRELQRNRFPVS
jgi:hypothetical protein